MTLTRSSLGRTGFIGELYDARTDSLSCRSLFKSSFPQKLIQTEDISKTEFRYKFTENLSDRFDILNVEAELQLTMMCGLIDVKGSGKFLSENHKTNQSVSCTLVCKIETVCQKIMTSFDELLPHIDISALESTENTHVICEISWGANCLLNLNKRYESESHKKEIEGSLSAQFAKLGALINADGKGQVTVEAKDLDDMKDIRIEVCADVVPSNNWPTTVEEFCRFVKEVPNLMKNVGGGKGKPLKYVMIPLSSICKIAKVHSIGDTMYKSIDEGFLLSLVYLFEEIDTLKRKFNDLCKFIDENLKYVISADAVSIQKQREELKAKEIELKAMISEDLVSVRSGTKLLKDLLKKVECFKSKQLCLYEYDDFLENYRHVREKLTSIKNYISQGIIYLGIGESFSDVANQNLTSEFIVLLVSSEMEKTDPSWYQNSSFYFLTLANEKKKNTKYVVIDLDYVCKKNDAVKLIEENNNETESFHGEEITKVRCFHLIGTDVISSDLYGEYLMERERSYVKLKQGKEVKYIQHQPNNRAEVEIVCPGFEMGSCGPEKLKWHCYRCKKILEYDLGDYCYCACGRGPANAFEFRCKNLKHGMAFIPAKDQFLKEQLSQLRSFKELNILILGQTGVGKSTWINSIVNYLHYDTIEKAKEGGVICRIPIQYTIYDPKTLKPRMVKIGQESDDEMLDVGSSATQSAHTYGFIWEERYVRLIDTPGLGDTRGINQDKENMRNIIGHIGHLKDLHGICILMKANDHRINAYLSYCLKELLVHLHRSAARNIVFCFTNSRNSFYTPGQTGTLLEKLLMDVGISNELALGKYTMFCLDNEAFLFLGTLQYPDFEYDGHLVKSFEQSWDISVRETKRLFSTIKSFKPHTLTETLSLVTARHRILSLTKPIAEISKTIQLNVAVAERKRAEVQTSNETLEELSKKLKVQEIHLEPIGLKFPRTVCTSSHCVRYYKYRNADITGVEYKTICHNECYLKNIETTKVNNPQLYHCQAMNNGKCNICGCGWETHMHITFDQKRVEVDVVNKNVEDVMTKEKSSKEKIEDFLKELEDKIQMNKEELEFVMQISAKFGKFLKDNAISVYNDAMSEYLRCLIEEEENKPHKSELENKFLQDLKETMNLYNAEVNILETALQNGEEGAEKITVEEIFRLEQNLYDLKIWGKQIKTFVDASRFSNEKYSRYKETSLYNFQMGKQDLSKKEEKKRKKWLFF